MRAALGVERNPEIWESRSTGGRRLFGKVTIYLQVKEMSLCVFGGGYASASLSVP